MNIHEYQAKQLLARFGVVVPPGNVGTTPEEARTTAEKLFAAGHSRVVVKSQIHAGGRGKGAFKSGLQGGVKVCSSAEEVFERAKVMLGVYQTWWECDASLVEINPLCLVETAVDKQTLMALDGKIALDDNALYRHADIKAMRDLAEEAPLEIAASQFSLNYIKLDGNIACLVNGAGLAMATMDIIQHYGGSP